MFGKTYTQEEVDEKFVSLETYNEMVRQKDRFHEDKEREWERKESNLKHEHTIEVSKLKSENELKLKEKEFELKHVADERVKKAEDEKTQLAKDLAVSQKENELLTSIIDVDSHVLDVKEIVTQLINKLPNVNITAGLSVGAPQGGKPAKENKE